MSTQVEARSAPYEDEVDNPGILLHPYKGQTSLRLGSGPQSTVYGHEETQGVETWLPAG